MRVLVFGGTGFLGSALVPRLLAQGNEVTVLTRDPAARVGIETAGVRALVGDPADPATFRTGIGDVDAMVLLAAPRLFGKRLGRARFERLKTELTAIHVSALELAREHRCPIVITGGTSFRTSGDQVADESWPIDRFGATRIGEDIDPLVERAVADGKSKVVWMLPGQIYGPGGMFLKMLEMAEKGRAVVLGDGENRLPRIHVDDCAAACAAAVDRLDDLASGDRFIVADDVSCTANEFMGHLCDLLGVRRPRHMPPFVARALLGSMLFETAAMDCRVSNARAKRVLGWTPRYPSHQEGLPATLKALRASRTEHAGAGGANQTATEVRL